MQEIYYKKFTMKDIELQKQIDDLRNKLTLLTVGFAAVSLLTAYYMVHKK